MKKKNSGSWQTIRRMWLVWSLGSVLIICGLYVAFSSTIYMTPLSDPNTLLSTWMTGLFTLGIGLVFIITGIGLFRLSRKAMYSAVVLSFLLGWALWSLSNAFGGTAPSSPSWGAAISSFVIAVPFLVGIALILHMRYHTEQGGQSSLRAKILMIGICLVFAIVPFVYQGYRYVADRSGHNLGSEFIFAQRYAAMSMDLNQQEFTYGTDLSPDDFLAKYPDLGVREDANTIYFDDTEISGMHANFCKLSDSSCRHKLDEMHPFNKVVYSKKYIVTFDSDFAYQRMAKAVGIPAEEIEYDR